MSVPGLTKTSKQASKKVVLRRFWPLFAHFLRTSCILLWSFWLRLDQWSIIQQSRRREYAGEGTELCAEEAGFGDAVLSTGGEGEEPDQWAAASGAPNAEYTGGGGREEDG